MTHSKLSKWVKRSALALVACAAFAMVSAEQAQAQFYGGRGVSVGTFGRGLSINIGGGGFNRGFGGFNSGFGGYNYGGFNRGYGGFNSGYRYVPQRSYYRGSYGGGRGYYGRY